MGFGLMERFPIGSERLLHQRSNGFACRLPDNDTRRVMDFVIGGRTVDWIRATPRIRMPMAIAFKWLDNGAQGCRFWIGAQPLDSIRASLSHWNTNGYRMQTARQRRAQSMGFGLVDGL